MKSTVIILLAALGVVTPVSAEKTGTPGWPQAASQYYAYPVTDANAPALTAAPNGYEPFHIEHYGRHGSRWLTQEEHYAKPVAILQKAQAQGKLTQQGIDLLGQLREVARAADLRYGELTPLGHRQHAGIAARMVRNFPEVLNAQSYLNANSTQVIRCILSMAEEVAEIRKLCPGIADACDASAYTQKMLNNTHADTVAAHLSDKALKGVAEYFASRPKAVDAFNRKVFNDPAWVRDSVGERVLFKQVFEVAANAQSHDNLYDLQQWFTPGEVADEWRERNAEWYVRSGNTPLTDNRPPYAQRLLLRNILESPDSTLTSPHKGANLRFGHESVLLPLLVLMELEGSDYSSPTLDGLEKSWRAYEYFPMACNLQLVFYRPADKSEWGKEPVLVKALLNEKEIKLPVSTGTFPYYKWSEVKEYYTGKLNGFETRFNEAF